MFRYIIRRILYTFPIALGVTVIVFSLVYLGPGDPLDAVLPDDATAADVQEIKKLYGFDKPLPVQYAIWLGRAVTGDLGTSIGTGQPVTDDLKKAVVNTLILAVFASIFGFTIAVVLGTVAGYQHGRLADKAVSAMAITGVSVPHYWLAIVLVIIFSVELNWLPSLGMGPGESAAWTLDWAHMRHMILPMIGVSIISMGIIARSMRASVAEILNQEFVQTLRSKGLMERQVLRHVMKNSAPTVWKWLSGTGSSAWRAARATRSRPRTSISWATSARPRWRNMASAPSNWLPKSLRSSERRPPNPC